VKIIKDASDASKLAIYSIQFFMQRKVVEEEERHHTAPGHAPSKHTEEEGRAG
jgi:hypothetical protein